MNAAKDEIQALPQKLPDAIESKISMASPEFLPPEFLPEFLLVSEDLPIQPLALP